MCVVSVKVHIIILYLIPHKTLWSGYKPTGYIIMSTATILGTVGWSEPASMCFLSHDIYILSHDIYIWCILYFIPHASTVLSRVHLGGGGISPPR